MSYLTTKQKKKRRGAYFLCESCKKEFYLYPCYLRRKNGSKARFCSMKCYDKRGEKNPFYGKKHSEDSLRKMLNHPNRQIFKTGKDNPNFVRFGEEYGFKGSRMHWWKRKLLKDIGKCEKCKLSDKRLLNLHHKDRNRSNNTEKNLELLCWNCHALHHWEEKTGPYHYRQKI